VDATLVFVYIAALAAAVGGGATVAWLLSSNSQFGQATQATSNRTLEQRLDELAESMRQSARLVEEVSAELDARAATAKQLKEEADTAQAIAGLHQEQMEAVRRVLDAELTGATRRIRGDSIKIGVASFIAGGGVSLLVTLLVPPLH
jgi:hypothetical protein